MAEAGDSSKMHYSDYTSWIPIAGPAIMGRRQKRLAAQINPTRPKYEIPSEIGANVNMYNSSASSSRLPAQSLMEDNLKASTSATFNQAQNAAGGSGGSAMLAALGRVNQNESNSVNQLNIAGAENQQANKDKLAQARNTMADYKQQDFDYNKNQPYELDLMRKRALIGAAMGNYDAGRQENQQLGLALLGSSGKGGGGKKASASANNSGGANFENMNTSSMGVGGSSTRKKYYTGSMGI